MISQLDKISIREMINAAKYPVVGIDLSGSEKKPSGWAVLGNGLAETKRLRSDQEIIEQTIKRRPAVIAIDAPLTLPRGRNTVFDEDPARHEFGITRMCERLMLQRGIRSYPPLIKSMQKLTLRGTALASHFRQLGFTVIETFSGGCQDVLGLARKQKGLTDLITGISSLGITGEHLQNSISHDEADAITASLAGLFFLHGQYEAIGDPDEGVIIFPDHRKTIWNPSVLVPQQK